MSSINDAFDLNLKSACLSIAFLPNLSDCLYHRRIILHNNLLLIDSKVLTDFKYIERRHRPYFLLAQSIASNWFGSLIVEDSYCDYWLLNGIRQFIGKFYAMKKCGEMLQRYRNMKDIRKLYKMMKKGEDTIPLYSNCYATPSEIQLSEVFNLKCRVVFTLLENLVERQQLIKLLKSIANKDKCRLSTSMFQQMVLLLSSSSKYAEMTSKTILIIGCFLRGAPYLMSNMSTTRKTIASTLEYYNIIP